MTISKKKAVVLVIVVVLIAAVVVFRDYIRASFSLIDQFTEKNLTSSYSKIVEEIKALDSDIREVEVTLTPNEGELLIAVYPHKDLCTEYHRDSHKSLAIKQLIDENISTIYELNKANGVGSRTISIGFDDDSDGETDYRYTYSTYDKEWEGYP